MAILFRVLFLIFMHTLALDLGGVMLVLVFFEIALCMFWTALILSV